MSTDYTVTTADPLDISLLEEFAVKTPGLSFELQPDSSNAIAVLTGRKGPCCAFTVDGPFSVEAEDLDDCVIAVVLDPKWMWQISVPAGAPQKATRIVRELCSFLSDRGRGAAYDAQEDRVFHPRGAAARYKPVSSAEANVNLIELEFMLPFSRVGPETAQQLLAIFRKYCPEAVPTRFGDFEPLQHRLQPGDDAPFLEFWRTAALIEYGGSFFWKAAAPCLSGSIFFSDKRTAMKNDPTLYASRHCLKLTFDGRALAGDARWLSTVVSLFRTIAVRLNAFYGACYVIRNARLVRTSVYYTKETDSYSLSPGRRWVGLPTIPTWLTWFGPGYCELIAPHLPDCQFVKESTPSGLLIQMGPEPMSRDQLEDYPKLPQSLQRLDYKMTAEVIPDVDPQ